MADYDLLRAQGAGPAALYAMIGESIGEALTNVMADRAMDTSSRQVTSWGGTTLWQQTN